MRARAAVSTLVLAAAACGPAPSPFGDEPVPTPRLFAPGVVSSGAREYGITFSPDATEAYFTRSRRRSPPRILTTRFVHGAWTEPQPASFSTDRDEAPYLTRDGRYLLFSSRRFVPRTYDRSHNLWIVERTAEGWSEPAPLPGPVNRPEAEIDDFDVGDEVAPLVLEDGVLLFTATTDPAWGEDIYVAERDESGAFVEPRPLRLNSYGDESHPAISPDRRHLVFQGYRDANGVGGQDLYVSERTEWGWSPPRLLPEPVNSSANDGYPRFSPDGRHFFFASDRDARGNDYSIYYVDTAALGLHTGAR